MGSILCFARRTAAGVAVLSGVALSGCGDDKNSACDAYAPPPSFDAQNPKVSFSNDVMPIFNRSCAFTSCHGSTTGSANGVFLGGSDRNAVHKALVGAPSTTLRTMLLVKAGDPNQSFLQHKVDGSQCAFADGCVGGDCGETMPRGSGISVETRDTFRRWIAQGAKND